MGISVKAGETTTYLYLTGIRPERRVLVSDSVALEPVSCDPVPDDMIDTVMKFGSKSEIDLGILIATLRLTTAQLVIHADNHKELAALAWNAQTDAFLISALLNRELYWHVQSSVDAASYNAEARINIVVPYLYLPREQHTLSEGECTALEERLVAARAMIVDERFLTAANALWSYRISPRPSTQLAVLWAGIETILGVKSELNFRISLLASKLLGTGAEGQRTIKKMYSARSKAVHEARPVDDKEVVQAAALLHKLILKCVELRHVPNEAEVLYPHDALVAGGQAPIAFA